MVFGKIKGNLLADVLITLCIVSFLGYYVSSLTNLYVYVQKAKMTHEVDWTHED